MTIPTIVRNSLYRDYKLGYRPALIRENHGVKKSTYYHIINEYKILEEESERQARWNQYKIEMNMDMDIVCPDDFISKHESPE